MRFIIRVIVLSLIPVIVRFILTLKISNGKDNRNQNEIILEYNVAFKLIFWICLFVFLVMLIIFVYEVSPEEMYLISFPIVFVLLSVFGILYTSKKIIVNKEEEYFIHKNMLFIKKKYNLKDIEDVFEHKLNGNIVLLLNNKKIIYVEMLITNAYEIKSYLHKKEFSFKKNNNLLDVIKYSKKNHR